MSSAAVFVRTLLKTSAIFIGTMMVFLHPPLEWTATRTVTAVQSPYESALGGLIGALSDVDAGVRRQVAGSLGKIANPRALPALRKALTDSDPGVRRAALMAISKIERKAAGR